MCGRWLQGDRYGRRHSVSLSTGTSSNYDCNTPGCQKSPPTVTCTTGLDRAVFVAFPSRHSSPTAAAGSPPRRTRRRHVELELESSSDEDEDEDEDEDARDLRELREVLERGDTT